MKKLLLILALASLMLLPSCRTDADVTSYNISQAAGSFEVFRRVVFYNGITDTYILQIEGFCQIEDTGGKIAVTVKTDNGTYLKHYLRRSDNVTYFAEQMTGINASTQRYRVIFKPSTIVPHLDKQ